MQLLKLYLKNFKSRPSTGGFTMIELLVAASLVVIVVTISGAGLVTIMSQNQKASAETAGRANLNRALDFISEDIKSASKVQAATAAGYTITTTPGCVITPMLALTIPIATGAPKTVVYYIKDISASSCGSVWLKPSIVKRVDLGTSGSTTIADADSDGNELVDEISTSVVGVPICAPTIPTLSPRGFYTCITSSNKFVNLTLIGTITDQGNSYNYQLSTNAFARN